MGAPRTFGPAGLPPTTPLPPRAARPPSSPTYGPTWPGTPTTPSTRSGSPVPLGPPAGSRRGLGGTVVPSTGPTVGFLPPAAPLPPTFSPFSPKPTPPGPRRGFGSGTVISSSVDDLNSSSGSARSGNPIDNFISTRAQPKLNPSDIAIAGAIAKFTPPTNPPGADSNTSVATDSGSD